MGPTRNAVVAVVFTAVALGWTVLGQEIVPGERPLDLPGALLVSLAGLALTCRLRWPVAVLGTTAAATALYLALGYPYGPVMLLFAMAVYTVARHLPWRRSVPAAVGALLLLLLHLLTGNTKLPGFLAVGPAAAWAVVPFAIGAVLNVRQEAERRRRAEAVERGVAQERLRVAQEVHDVVGHGLAAMKMQADIALHVLDKDPAYARTALEAVSRTSAEALDELRATLHAVRRDRRAPGPGLADLPALYRRMREAGLRVTSGGDGPPPSLPPQVDLAAYRIVQEALTNALKHAPERRADVRIDHRDGVLALTVRSPAAGRGPGGGESDAEVFRAGWEHDGDRPGASPAGREHGGGWSGAFLAGRGPGGGRRAGAGASAAGRGLGVQGMRERATAVGGTLSAGPEEDGSFVVAARLPVPEREDG